MSKESLRIEINRLNFVLVDKDFTIRHHKKEIEVLKSKQEELEREIERRKENIIQLVKDEAAEQIEAAERRGWDTAREGEYSTSPFLGAWERVCFKHKTFKDWKALEGKK